MIITGGSTILVAYVENITGRVRRVPGKVREHAAQRKVSSAPNPPGRPDLRNNFMGRLRAVLNWFSNLPTLRRRTILARALIPATVAFVIGMGVVTALEVGAGQSLSCGLWNKCPTAYEGAGGTRPTLALGRDKVNANVAGDQRQHIDSPDNQTIEPDPSAPSAGPSESAPAESDTPASPAAEEPIAEEPVVEEDPAEAPAPEPPAPEDPAAGGDEPAPSEP